MRCNWSTTANIISRKRSSRLPTKIWFEPREKLCIPSSTQFSSARSIYHTFHGPRTNTSHFVANKTYGTPSRLKSTEINRMESPTVAPMTVAQMSRAASKAVRLSISDGELANAYFIINSLRYSLLDDNQSSDQMKGLRIPLRDFDPVDFGRPVSPRLSAHALLHGLIRIGLTVKSYRLAQLMMEEGMKIRTTTLEAIFRSLLSQPPFGVKDGSRWLGRGRASDGSEVLCLHPNMVSDRSTRYALRLLTLARFYRQRRTQDMYQSLINACLLQGEIIVGSLLFVMVVKDWQLRKTLTARLTCGTQESDTSPEPSNGSAANLRDLHALHSESPFPSKIAMGRILASIEATMSSNLQDDSAKREFQAALQALANLGVLLDNRQIPFREVAPLIRALYRCPRVQNEVWIRRKKVATRVKAYPYFHGLLKRLVDSMPSQRPDVQSKDMLPPLHTSAYNSLLHYALRHRLSPSLANTVLTHMTTQRKSPLKPNIVTYNILIRSATLLRRSDIGERALENLRQIKGNGHHAITVEPSGTTIRSSSSIDAPHDASATPAITPHPTSRFSKALHRLETEDLDMSNIAPSLHDAKWPLLGDSFTLVAYVSHLTSTGQPHIVAKILFRVLPELVIVDHPSWGSMTVEERQNLRAISREACLARAVTYGPHFFTVMLNALCKAGKTGLAERVWLLAKEAERVSWIPDFAPNLKPWCLPVHAYTIMIQCYSAEARKGLGARETDWRFNEPPSNSSWSPRSNRKVRGWAHFILARHRIASRNLSRRYAGQKMGMMLFRSMMSGAKAVYDSLIKINRSNAFANVQLPAPDARFFNAALDLFARQPYMSTRGTRTGLNQWRRHLRQANMLYARKGTISKHWTPFLQEIAEEMVDAGYSLPPAFRNIFIGRWIPGTLQLDDRQELQRRPFSFPTVRHDTFRAHAVPTLKSRGLPVGRRWQLRHRRTHLAS